ncbi:MAG: Bifunctional protein FolD [Patescibacteria group bacterium]|nr:Bifunctional protein FolD [Patescibacteria group bacterium]
MILLSGIQTRDFLKERLVEEIGLLPVKPKLVILQIGDNEESNVYIKQKKNFGEKLGIVVEHKKLSSDVKEQEVIDIIDRDNKDNEVGGIIVQLPIPKNLNISNILNSIEYKKDVDGLGFVQRGMFYGGNINALVPATARGVMSLLDYYKINIESKHVVVIGRSSLVGGPISQSCLKRNATVTVCHSKTENIKDITKTADVLIVACGVLGMVDSTYVRGGQVVIDVGIHKTDRGLRGDVVFDDVKDIVSAISPVPGGVGPLTVLSLFQNLIDAQKI